MNHNNEIFIGNIFPSEIKSFYSGEKIKVSDDVDVGLGILQIEGKYPDGSAGAHVGEYLRGLSAFIREYYRLDALIIDLVKLEYKWGNNLLGIAKPETFETSSFVSDTWLGYYIVGSETNKDALHSLFCEFGKSSGINKIYLSKSEIIKDVLGKAKKIYK